VLTVTKSHSGNFTQGQTEATYIVTVGNTTGAPSTSGQVTLTETVPSGLTLVSMAGTSWACGGTTCSRSDSLLAGKTYPAITVTVNVGATAASPQINTVSVSGGGSATATASDSTTVISLYSPCDINEDGITNVADVQSIINEALGVTQAANDLNGDGSVNVADVQIVINAALGLGCTAT
jgi:uncharacterized repeat protein (TIGR01451 family)